MQLTNEQYIAIGAQVSEADTLLGKGHIAVAAVAPLLLVGITQEEVTAFVDGADPDDLMPEGWARALNEIVFDRRLARLTAKPDHKLIDKVREIAAGADNLPTISVDTARAIVAAVDAARLK